MSLAAFAQKYWADNQVSCTVTFDPITEGNQIEYALDYFQYQLKGISLLPRAEAGAYAQMPYEAITAEEYQNSIEQLSRLTFGRIRGEEVVVERFCDSDVCQLDFAEGEDAPPEEIIVDLTSQNSEEKQTVK
jgi:hypothetical protein